MDDTRKSAEYILQRALGHYAKLDDLAKEAVDLILMDRITIKILGRNIESLTMQMKTITQVTFERDKLLDEIEAYKDRIELLKDRLAKYE